MMVRDIRGEENATMYSGLLVSVFAGAEAATAWLWGDLSDRLGRKPCILVALAGTALSCLIFGFSKQYWLAITARVIGGFLNGNTAVMQTMVTELVKNPKHEPIAFSMQPFMWYVGSIAGSALGGFTARPIERWPSLKGGIFEEYPYLLPNVLSTIAIIMASTVGWLFLHETNTVANEGRFQANRTPNTLIRVWHRLKSAIHDRASYRRGSTDSTTPFLDEEKPDRESIKAMTRPVLGWILALAILSYHQMAFAAQLPPFLEDDKKPTNFFSGGLGKTLPQVSIIQTVNSIFSLVAQGLVYPAFSAKFGVWKSTYISLALAVTPYTLLPMVKHLPNPDAGIYTVIVLQCLATTASYPLVLILLKNACPSPEVLGRINGVAMSACSLARTFAPPLVGIFYDRMGAAFCWWSVAVFAIGGFLQLFFSRRPPFTS